MLSRTCRARFPADRKMLIRSVFVRFQSSRIPAFVCGPREARGQRLASLGVGGGGTSLRSDGAPRFARTENLASLGQAELRKWLNSVGAYVFLCSANPWRGAAMEGSRASTYHVAYHVEGSSGDGLQRPRLDDPGGPRTTPGRA